MGRHAKAWHINADNAHAIDLFRQQLQRHARSGGHAEIGDDDRVVKRRISHFKNGSADVFEQFARDQRFRIERHITNRALRTIEMGREGQAINAASRA